MENETLNICGKPYLVLGTYKPVTLADSFIVKSNKLGSGNGEAKLYVGNEGGDLRKFFGAVGFTIDCFMLRRDLISFLRDLSDEYLYPKLPYKDKNNLPNLFSSRLAEVQSLDEVITLNISEKVNIAPPRIYVQSEDLGWEFIRKLSLPNLSQLYVMKLQDLSNHKRVKYYLRLIADKSEVVIAPYEQPKDVQIPPANPRIEREREQIQKARVGQGKYREQLLENCQYCPVTMVSDERILIASHIKPWKDSTDSEKVDPYNGFMFTPTIDKLFDRGFMSFSEDGRMMISPWISKTNVNRLGLIDGKRYERLPLEASRLRYLDFHRANVFKGT